MTGPMSAVWSRSRFMLVVVVLALCSCRHRIPPEYEYPPGWIREEHPSASARYLSGMVTDPSGAPIEHVLVERMTADFKTRLDARVTDSRGRFSFRWMDKGTYYLRFRYRAFNDYLLPVEVSPKSEKSSLDVRLEISN
jgi:hypothetical protein